MMDLMMKTGFLDRRESLLHLLLSHTIEDESELAVQVGAAELSPHPTEIMNYLLAFVSIIARSIRLH